MPLLGVLQSTPRYATLSRTHLLFIRSRSPFESAIGEALARLSFI